MTKSKNADRIGVENIKKKIANGLLPSVRSSQDEDTEISRSIEEVSATSSKKSCWSLCVSAMHAHLHYY